MPYETITFEVADHVGTITLDRPDTLNAFNQQMCDEFADLYARVREDDDVHVLVLRANGDRAFSTGVDVGEWVEVPDNPFALEDPGASLSPKANQCWKPMVAAVHGMAAGGAFYWLNEADIVICSDDATFFDPHVTYGMVSALEPIGLARRVNLGDVLRWALLGLDERLSADRALQIGLVTEVTTRDELWGRAAELAAIIAAKPPVAIQGTVRAVWESLDLPRTVALQRGLAYPQLGNEAGTAAIDRDRARPNGWSLR